MGLAADLTREGIAAAGRGNRAEAADLLKRATDADPRYEMAWLWRSSLAGTDEEKRGHLQQALKANPRSESAKRGLALLGPAIEAPPELVAPVTVPAPRAPLSIPDTDHALLQRTIAASTANGWQVVFQTDTSAQLKKPKQWSAAGLALFVTLPGVIGCFWFPAFGIALIGLVLVLVTYLAGKDELLFVDTTQIRQREATDAALAQRTAEILAAPPATRLLGWQRYWVGMPWGRILAVIMFSAVVVAGAAYWLYSNTKLYPRQPPAAPLVYGTVVGYTEVTTGHHVVDIDLFDKPASAPGASHTVAYIHEGQRLVVVEQRADGTVKLRTPDGIEGWTQIDSLIDIR